MSDVMELARRRRRLIDTLIELSAVQSPDALVAALRCSTRAVAAADGIAVARREPGGAVWIAEDADAPVPWRAQDAVRAIRAGRPLLVADARHGAGGWGSVAIFPFGNGAMALGAGWTAPGAIDAEAVALLTTLARSAGVACARIERMTAARQAFLARRSA